METQPTPPMDLDARAWRHLTQTLIALFPSPIQDTPEATETRNHAAQSMLDSLPEEPKTEPESRAVGNETPTGQPPPAPHPRVPTTPSPTPSSYDTIAQTQPSRSHHG